MKTKNLKKLERKLLKVGSQLYTIKSLSRILLGCMYDGDNLKPQDTQSLAQVLDEKIYHTKKLFNEIEQRLGI